MSRTLKTACGLLQSANPTAGPSSLPPILLQKTAISRNTPLQSRSISFGTFDRFLRPFRPSTPATSTSTPTTAAPIDAAKSEPSGSLFDDVVEEELVRQRRRKASEHRYSTAQHKISPRKLNDISRQIAGLPVDEAIVQMEFSEKRASSWIKSTLCLARDHATDKGIDRSKMIVSQSWVSKGPKIKRVDIKGRGRAGIKYHPLAKLYLLLKEGKTQEEKVARKFQKEMSRVRSAGVVREDGVLRRKVISGWAW